MKKRMIGFALALSLMISLTTFAGATVEEATVPIAEEGPVLELECMDFYENQDYYMSLVEEKDYTLHFDVNEENREFILDKMSENASCVSELQPVMTRGTTAPTQRHDFNTGKFFFEGDAEYSDLYTKKYCTSAERYIVTLLHDTYESNLLKVTAYNVIRPQQITYFSSGVTVKKYTISATSYTSAINKHFYLKFHVPVHVKGDIARG